MPPRPSEGLSQAELLLRLRAAIDTAEAYQTRANVDKAIALATDHPRGVRSTHVRANLGDRRWRWLEQHGVYPVGQQVEIAGGFGVKGTIEPDITT